MLIKALFRRAEKLKQSKCSSTDTMKYNSIIITQRNNTKSVDLSNAMNKQTQKDNLWISNEKSEAFFYLFSTPH